MKKVPTRLLSLFLAVVLALSAVVPALAAGADWTQALDQAAAYVKKTVPDPQPSSTFGEWAVIGLARGERLDSAQRDRYLENLEAVLREKQGVLSSRKHTEYDRAILALTALGEDPRDAAGYDLLAPLEDFDQTVRQGLNGAVFALIALDSGGYDAAPGLREQYLQYILDAQLADGGWALSGSKADPDVTAQALQALAPYRADQEKAVVSGLACLTTLRSAGAYSTSEAYAQTVIALCALDEPVPDDLLAELLSFQRADGGFAHLPEGATDQMASEQALCALTALERAESGRSPLYQMEDAARGASASLPFQVLAVPLLAALVPATLLRPGFLPLPVK